jgi:hypothetical protein
VKNTEIYKGESNVNIYVEEEFLIREEFKDMLVQCIIDSLGGHTHLGQEQRIVSSMHEKVI